MQSLDDLIEPVTEATTAGDLAWVEDGLSSYSVDIGKYRIVTWSWTDENDGTSGVTVHLKEGRIPGDVLDSIMANEYVSRYDRLSQFLAMARRSALNVDSIITDLKSDLKAIRRRAAG